MKYFPILLNGMELTFFFIISFIFIEFHLLNNKIRDEGGLIGSERQYNVASGRVGVCTSP